MMLVGTFWLVAVAIVLHIFTQTEAQSIPPLGSIVAVNKKGQKKIAKWAREVIDKSYEQWYPEDDVGHMKGIVRCHKCLFSDEGIPSGDISLLFRAADSHNRLITPLEITTNGNNLPGGAVAMVMYLKGEEALRLAMDAVHPVEYPLCRQGQCLASNLHANDIFTQDLEKFNRVLQYAIAVNVTEDFLRKDVWQYYVEIYRSSDLNTDVLVEGLKTLAEFYRMRLDPTLWTWTAAPKFETLIRKLDEAKHYISTVLKESQFPQKAPRASSDFSASHLEEPPDEVFELLVDPRLIDPGSVSSSGDMESLVRVQQRWTTV